jgi:hypothetical protein
VVLLQVRVPSHCLLRLSLVALIIIARIHRVRAARVAAAVHSLIEAASVSAAHHLRVTPFQARLLLVLVRAVRGVVAPHSAASDGVAEPPARQPA